jgi:hypothetical protein
VSSRKGRKFLFFIGAVCIIALCIPSKCLYAFPLSFDVFTDNGPWGVNGANYGDPGLDLYVEVTNGGEDVSFTLHNESDPSLGDVAITDVYFDDGTLRELTGVVNGPGVYFDKLASPEELPGANLLIPPFVTSDQFSADSDPPPPRYGVESGEWVTINFDLWPGGSLANVINELENGTLRIGIKVQAFPGGSSESAVNVPEPATICLLGLGALALLRKRRI